MYVYIVHIQNTRAWEPEPGVFGSLEPEPGVFGSLEPEPEPLEKKPRAGAGAAWKKRQEPEPLKN